MFEKNYYVVDDNRVGINVPPVLTWVSIDGQMALLVPMLYVETEDKALFLYGVPVKGISYE